MPLARNIFYDIKIKIKELASKFEDKNNIINKKDNLKENMKKLIDNYKLEKQTNSDIFEFYCKKYNDLITFNENELKLEEEALEKKEKENEISQNVERKKEEKEDNESKSGSNKENKHKGRNKKQKNKNEE